MDIQTLSLIASSIHLVKSLIWLTINDNNVTTYNTSDNVATPITFLCHQQTNWESKATWIYRTRAISKLSSTNPTSLSNPTNGVWNDTFEWPDYGGPQIYVDQRRTTLASRWQTTQYYWATGYAIVAPLTSDSGVYRCRGVIAFGRTRIPEESAPVTLVVKRDVGPTTLLTVSENVASVIEMPVDYIPEIRCHTFIPDTQATVLYHRVFKAQNLTKRYQNGAAVEFAMTNWQMVYEFNRSIYGSAAKKRQVTNQDLTSGFNIPSPGYTDTGLYFCSAVYTVRDGGLLTVNSSIVFLDARGLPNVYLAISLMNDANQYDICRYGVDEELYKVCKLVPEDHFLAICFITSYDFIPEIQMVLGNGSAEGYQRFDYNSGEIGGNGETGSFRSRSFASSIKKSFFAFELCRAPEVSCSAAVPGFPSRVQRRTIILLSDYCKYDQVAFLRSQGAIVDVVPSMIFVSLVTLVLIPKLNMDLHEHGQL